MTARSKPLVSIIIPTYNQAELLQEALRSVLDQSFTNWEAIVVNNFSDDETEKVVRDTGDDRIRLINFRNHGVIGASRNQGAHNSSGEFIAFLDSDDTWHSEKLKKVMALFEQSAGIDLVCNDEHLVSENGKSQVLTYGPHNEYADLLFRGNCLSTSAIVLRRDKFFEVGGFSENREFMGVEDYDLWLRLARAGCRFFYYHEVLGIFRVHEGAFTSKIERHCQNILNLFEAHFAEWPRQSFYFRFLMRRQKAITMRSAARKLLRQGERKNARRLITRSLYEDPFSLKTWVLSIIHLTRVGT